MATGSSSVDVACARRVAWGWAKEEKAEAISLVRVEGAVGGGLDLRVVRLGGWNGQLVKFVVY